MNILLINGASNFSSPKGELNRSLHAMASDLLAEQHENEKTIIEDGYDVASEVEKFLWADVVVYQMPAWWMGAPWTVKKYMDEVLIAGHGALFANDGRTRDDPSKQYGTGGYLTASAICYL